MSASVWVMVVGPKADISGIGRELIAQHPTSDWQWIWLDIADRNTQRVVAMGDVVVLTHRVDSPEDEPSLAQHIRMLSSARRNANVSGVNAVIAYGQAAWSMARANLPNGLILGDLDGQFPVARTYARIASVCANVAVASAHERVLRLLSLGADESAQNSPVQDRIATLTRALEESTRARLRHDEELNRLATLAREATETRDRARLELAQLRARCAELELALSAQSL